MPDINAWGRQAPFLMVQPMTPAGRDWMATNCPEATTLGPFEVRTYCVEHRYAPDILLAAHWDGLEVVLEGRLVDAET